MEQNNKIALLGNRKIRRIAFEGKIYLAVLDVIKILTDTAKPSDYWYRLKKRELDGSGIELSTFCRTFKLEAADGKRWENCWKCP